MSDCPLRKRMEPRDRGAWKAKRNMEVGEQHDEGAEPRDQGKGDSPRRRKARRNKGKAGPDPLLIGEMQISQTAVTSRKLPKMKTLDDIKCW